MTAAVNRLKQPIIRMFDTHKYIKLFKSKGIKEQQAEVFIQAISDSLDMNISNLATKEQIADLSKRIDQLEKRIEWLEQGQRWMIGIMLSILALVVKIAFFQ